MLTELIKARKGLIQGPEIIPWKRDLSGDIFVANLNEYYGEGNYTAHQQLHRGGSGSGASVSKSGQQLMCHDYARNCGDTLSRYDVKGLLRYPLVFKYFEDPRQSATIDKMCEVTELLMGVEYDCPDKWNELCSDFSLSLEALSSMSIDMELLETLSDLKYRLETDVPSFYSQVSSILNSKTLVKSLDISNVRVKDLSIGAHKLVRSIMYNYNSDYNFEFTDKDAALEYSKLSYDEKFLSLDYKDESGNMHSIDIFDNNSLFRYWENRERSLGLNREYPNSLSNSEVYAFIQADSRFRTKDDCNFQCVEAYTKLHLKAYGRDSSMIKALEYLVSKSASRSSHYVSGLADRLIQELANVSHLENEKFKDAAKENLEMINNILLFCKDKPIGEELYASVPPNEIPRLKTCLKLRMSSSISTEHTKLCRFVLNKISKVSASSGYAYVNFTSVLKA